MIPITKACPNCGNEADSQGTCFDPDCADTVTRPVAHWGHGMDLDAQFEYHETQTGYDFHELPPGDTPGSASWADTEARHYLRLAEEYGPSASDPARKATAILWLQRVIDRLRG